jgi:hypothetical protein
VVTLFSYVNLEDPWRRTAIGFDSWDHVLDVAVAPDVGYVTPKEAKSNPL